MQIFVPTVWSNGEGDTMMLESDKISVVVPVYNVKDYLKKCVASILEQTYTNFELLLIDDGSIDGSGEICDLFVSQDSRVKTLHVDNGGVSRARNRGIQATSGQWICFIDSDDWVDKTMLEKLIKAAKEHSAKLACCFFDEYRNGKTERLFSLKNKYRADAKEIAKAFCFNSELKSLMCPLWDKLFDAECAKKLDFHSDLRIGEDFLFCLQYVAANGKMAVVTEPLYHYRIRPGSAMQEKFSEKKMDYLKAADRVVDVYEKCFPDYKSTAESWRYVHTLNMCNTIRKSGMESEYSAFLQKSNRYLKDKRPIVWVGLAVIYKVRLLCYLADRMVYDMRRSIKNNREGVNTKQSLITFYSFAV